MCDSIHYIETLWILGSAQLRQEPRGRLRVLLQLYATLNNVLFYNGYLAPFLRSFPSTMYQTSKRGLRYLCRSRKEVNDCNFLDVVQVFALLQSPMRPGEKIIMATGRLNWAFLFALECIKQLASAEMNTVAIC